MGTNTPPAKHVLAGVGVVTARTSRTTEGLRTATLRARVTTMRSATAIRLLLCGASLTTTTEFVC